MSWTELLCSTVVNAGLVCTVVVNNTGVFTKDIAKPYLKYCKTCPFSLNRLMTDSFGTSTWLKISSALMWVLFLTMCIYMNCSSVFSWNVYLSLIEVYLKTCVADRSGPGLCPRKPSSWHYPSWPSSSLLVSLRLLLMNAHQLNLKRYYSKAMRNNLMRDMFVLIW